MRLKTNILNRFLPFALSMGVSSIAGAAHFQKGVEAIEMGDYQAAFRELKPLAEQGDALAEFNLALLYDKGKGITQDSSKAANWFQKAAERGVADAQYAIGVMYANGESVPQDYGRAISWYRKAAQQGHLNAQFNLGHIYARGQGEPQDFIKAHFWLNLAASQGDADAASLRDGLAEYMTSEQVSGAQALAREWSSKNR